MSQLSRASSCESMKWGAQVHVCVASWSPKDQDKQEKNESFVFFFGLLEQVWTDKTSQG